MKNTNSVLVIKVKSKILLFFIKLFGKRIVNTFIDDKFVLTTLTTYYLFGKHYFYSYKTIDGVRVK